MTNMLEALSRGVHGVRFAIDSNAEVLKDEPEVAHWVDAERSLAWYAFFGTRLTVDLSEAARPSLQRDVAAHAIFLRDEMLQSQPHQPSLHHPLVSCEVTVPRCRSSTT